MLTIDTTLPSGRGISLRPLERGDTGTVAEVFDGMSHESRYFRFLQATPRLTASLARHLADVDGERHQAAVAYHGGRPVGMVRLVMDSSGDVEIAVEVVDALHGLGLGSILVDAALDTARSAGHTVVALIHGENGRAMKMFRKRGFRFQLDDGVFAGRLAPATELVAA